MLRRLLATLPVLGLLAACGHDDAASPGAVTGDDANLTASTAARLKVPLEILRASIIIKPSPMDQSGLGVVLAPNVAFADGATSQALPHITDVDAKPFAEIGAATIAVGEERYGVMADWDDATPGDGVRLVGMTPAPLLEPGAVTAGKECQVLGTDLDMYASGPPKLESLEGKIDRVKDGLVLVKTTRSTGGEMSLLVCDGKVAGISAGAGSQGTYHEFHVLDTKTLSAFTSKRDTCAHAHRCR